MKRIPAFLVVTVMMLSVAAAAGADPDLSDMIIANASDFHIIHKLVEGREFGTIFLANPKEEFYLLDYLENA